MNLKQILNKNNLHHAYCLEGNNDAIVPLIISFLEKEMGINTQNNPDVHIDKYDTFSIEESRSLKEKQQKMSFGDRKVFIISFSFITREAQNALLKIFEEPTNNTHLFIILKTASVLLPTLRSRLVINSFEHEDIVDNKVKVFVNSNIAKRLSFLKEMIENKDKSKAIDFATELEIFLSKDKKSIVANRSFLSDLSNLKKFLFAQGASIKLVLEQIALTCPKV